RSTRTHFARFVVLDDVPYNGRAGGDSIIALAERKDPLTAQPVDELASPYLIFAADFDADSGDDSALRSYASKLWLAMPDELVEIFEHCRGFDPKTMTADGFCDYLKSC